MVKGSSNMNCTGRKLANSYETVNDIAKNEKKFRSSKKAIQSSKERRTSTSLDEGIAQSPDEMYESGKKLPHDKESNHIAITIKGGRESKHKKKIACNNKDCHRHTRDLKTEVTSPPSSAKFNDRASEKEETIGDRTCTSVDVANLGRAVRRKVVREALRDTSSTKQYKPVWVELPKKRVEKSDGKSKNELSKSEKTYKDNANIRRKQNTKPSAIKKNGLKVVKPILNRQIKDKKPNNLGNGRIENKFGSGRTNEKFFKAHHTTSDNKDVQSWHENMHYKKQEEKGSFRSSNQNGWHSREIRPLFRNKTKKNRQIEVKESDQESCIKSTSIDSSVRDLSYTSSSTDSSSTTSSSSPDSSLSHPLGSTASYYSSQKSLNVTSSSSEDHEISFTKKEVVKQPRSKLTHYKASGEQKFDRIQPTALTCGKTTHLTHDPNSDVNVQTVLDLLSLRKANRSIEKSIPLEDGEEFEVDLARRRKLARQHTDPVENVNKDSTMNLWQHQRLVMTSWQPDQSTAAIRQVEKTKTADQNVRSFEASGKDSSGAILTIRDLYSLHHVLSDTQNGTVISGHRRSDGMRVAIKRISKSGTTRWGWMKGKMVPLELALLCQVNEVRHLGVVEIIEWHETTEAFLLVMARPHPSIDLYDHVTKQKRLKEHVARRIIKQLVDALLHCQKMGVLHRDVKLENILFNPVTSEAILIDFGCGDYCRSSFYKEFAGTPEYYPPEWFLYKQYNGESATVWSVGVLLYSLLCGTLPFRSSKDIMNKDLSKLPVEVSRHARHLIKETLKKKPNDRIDLKSISSHSWLKSSNEHPSIRKASV